MKAIFKYDLQPNMSVPKGAKILHVGAKANEPLCLWMLVDPDQQYEQRSFEIIGTGQLISYPSKSVHIGTVIQGAFVWHIFETIK